VSRVVPDTTKAMNRVCDVLPEFANELVDLLFKSGETELASQVSGLQIVDRCRCGDDFCSTFYVQPKPRSAWNPDHRNVVLEPEKGMLILDVVEGKVACVEALFRDEIRPKLLALLP
jgi:hypothetical protein